MGIQLDHSQWGCTTALLEVFSCTGGLTEPVGDATTELNEGELAWFDARTQAVRKDNSSTLPTVYEPSEGLLP